MLDVLNKYYEEGWLIKQTHPTLPLTIWNYSQTTQYERNWDEITLQARGLVTDELGKVAARPFKKFFNMEEAKHTPTSEFEVFEKMDGSLGILFNYNGEWVFASRGSFTSEQALKFKEMFLSKYQTELLTSTNTYLFEIIYPENRVVVDYGGLEDVVLLGVIETQTGKELELTKYEELSFNVVKRYEGIEGVSFLKRMITDNQEGFVVKFSNGERMKVKGEEYLRLHKIMTEVSTKSVWEVLSSGGSMESILQDVPDEFYVKIKEYEVELLSKFKKLKYRYEWYFSLLPKEDRKKFALSAKETEYPSLLFRMLNGQSPDEVLWKILKPEFKKL